MMGIGGFVGLCGFIFHGPHRDGIVAAIMLVRGSIPFFYGCLKDETRIPRRAEGRENFERPARAVLQTPRVANPTRPARMAIDPKIKPGNRGANDTRAYAYALGPKSYSLSRNS